jgi:long-chain acyl-CoA synthetase
LTVLVTRDDTRSFDVAHWDDALNSHSEVDELPDVDVLPGDSASIMYTSGTTGFPKGALHTHLNHVTNIRNGFLAGAIALALLPPAAAGATAAPTPSSLQTFPFFHIGGLTGLYMAAANGSKLVLMYKWDVNQALELIQREGVLTWAAVPTLVRELLESPNASAEVLDSVVSIGSGGAPVPADLINQIGEQFNARVAPGNGYGATETTSAIITNGGADYFARPGSVGRPVATVDIRIVDDDLRDCGVGVIGELWARGPNVFEGYWNKPAETQAAFSDGWFRTGDLGYVDDEGFYYVVDRKKDVIIRAGENVYCAEVEGVLHEHPEIVDVALIGLPHRSLGEEVAVVVELKPGAQVSEADIQNHVASRIARYNVPSKVFFTDDPLPRTATGKILKRELKQRYGG